jgi:hypothetical protein
MKLSLHILYAVALYISLQSCQKSTSPQLRVTDIGAFTCDSTEQFHSRLCPSGLEVILGEQMDTIIYTGKYGQPIIHSIIEANGNKYLLTENEYLYQFGFKIVNYELYDLSPKNFMSIIFRQQLVLNEEVSRENDGNYTHYVNKTSVDVAINDTLRFNINRYSLICPESESQCDTVHAIYEYIDFALP